MLFDISAAIAGLGVFVVLLLCIFIEAKEKVIKTSMVLVGLILTVLVGKYINWNFLVGVAPWGWVLFGHFTIRERSLGHGKLYDPYDDPEIEDGWKIWPVEELGKTESQLEKP